MPLSRPRAALFAAAVVAVVLAAAYAWRSGALARLGSGGRPRNLLLVTIDTLRADRLGSYGYAAAQTPNLDALARRGLRFTQATTVVPLTLPAHSSLLTGTFPAWHGVRDNGGFYLGDDQLTLAEVLKDKGFRTGGFVSAFVLDRRWGIAQGFERFFDDFDLEKFSKAPSMDFIQRPGSETVEQAMAWLGEDRARPFFAWVHLYDPHAPYEAPEPYRSRFPATLQGAYDAEIASADADVGHLLDGLARQGRLEDTLVVVLADHGEMLGEHGEQQHGFFIYDGAVRIPLLMAGPGLAPRTISDQVRIVDVMPTALELLGVARPAAVQGTSLLPLTHGQRLGLVAHSETWYPRYHYGWSELRSVQDGRFKLIEAPRPELYDLDSDRSEGTDLAGGDAARAQSMRAALAAFESRTTRAGAAKGPAPVDAETEEKLAALGYVGSVSGSHMKDVAGVVRGDPKDKIGLYNLLKKAGSASGGDNQDEAIALVRSALRQDPTIVEGYMLLGNFLSKAKRLDDAVAAYKQALALDPEHQNALFSLAVAYKDGNRLEDARLGFERARALDPRNGKVLFQLADLALRQKRPQDAEAIIRDALARKVDEHRFLQKLGESYIESKRYAEAEKALKEALAKKADLPAAQFDLGLVYEDTGRPEMAIVAYRAELARAPTAHRAAFNLAKLLARKGELAEATSLFRKVVEVDPNFGTGRLYLAKALLDANDLPGAEDEAKKGLAQNPDPQMAPLGHYVLADVYSRLGREQEARREAALAKRLERPVD